MAAQKIANESMTLKATAGGGWTPCAFTSPASVTVQTVKAAKAKMDGKAVLIDRITWVVTVGACTLAGSTHKTGGSAVTPTGPTAAPVTATAQKTKCDKKAVLREEDGGTCCGVFTMNNQAQTPTFCNCSVKIDSAGQIKVKGL